MQKSGEGNPWMAFGALAVPAAASAQSGGRRAGRRPYTTEARSPPAHRCIPRSSRTAISCSSAAMEPTRSAASSEQTKFVLERDRGMSENGRNIDE